MKILIIGAGKSGVFLAEKLRATHDVTIVEKRPDQADDAQERMPGVTVVRGDACEPTVLDNAGIARMDLVASLTGDDEDNLVVSLLAKFHNQVPLVFARVNHPANEWLFNKDWGVDIGVSSAGIIYSLVEKETTLGDTVMLMRLQAEDMAIEELTLPSDAAVVGKSLAEVHLPERTHIMAIVTADREVKVPRGDTVLASGDHLMLLSDTKLSADVRAALGVTPTSR